MIDPRENAASAAPFFSMHGMNKSFGSVVAIHEVEMDIHQGEVLALLGENGAGKSTLVKILYGFYAADSGTIRRNGKAIQIDSPQDAREYEIGMVFQQFNLIPAFSVAENIALFTPNLSATLDMKHVSRQITDLSERYKLQVNPEERVADLSIGDRQKVEILKLLISDARLLILDEPTRVLAPHEIDALFEVLNTLSSDGYAIILITHKLHEVLEIADRITVLRGGEVAGSITRETASEAKLIEMMFGHKVTEFAGFDRSSVPAAGTVLLDLQQVSTTAEGTEVSLAEINLKVVAGEIVGIAGVSGEGQRELADLVLGKTRATFGKIMLGGEDATGYSINRIRRSGVVFVPESPLVMAAAPYMTVLENMAVPESERYARRGGLTIDWETIKRDYGASMERLGFSIPLYTMARSLSGGNLQRMVIAREMAHDPVLIIASYLTSGLDVQSAIAARRALVQARTAGAGVLFFSEDLDELFSLSDRLIVIYGGRIRGNFDPVETNSHEIGYLMTGSEAEHVC
jgi:simple sugar transport system ATP-binding protein